MKRWIHATEDEDWEWSPYSKGIYRVTGGYTNKFTNNPKTAIRYWYQMQAKNPMDCMIMCAKRDQAVKLCEAATEDLIFSLSEKYKCPYDPAWIVSEAAKKVADGCKWFHEDDYGYGDSVHPFGVG